MKVSKRQSDDVWVCVRETVCVRVLRSVLESIFPT